MEDKFRPLTIRILIVLVILLFGLVSALGLFEHPAEVIILAIPLVTFQFLILSGQSSKWIVVSGITNILVLIIEVFVNLFYYHFLG